MKALRLRLTPGNSTGPGVKRKCIVGLCRAKKHWTKLSWLVRIETTVVIGQMCSSTPGTGMNSQPDILTSQDVEQLLRLLPKYRVLLHNDDVNAMDFVVQALLRTVQRLTVDE